MVIIKKYELINYIILPSDASPC